ncbi:DNA repair protein RecN [Bacillus sp. FJAT-45350]|uniref:DNA repair protein RecN n=1 Tax=Bacillus sp. FJAT-45350 TaxID=2011014 RepID=UPI000BB7BA19|nr:DNA repair protein RecN [Bacillus sp. FJAT-45350]
MLIELTIKNFAIIDELTISFEKGLTVLTGETGAGKSIIIDAIGLLTGGRGSSEFVRYGTNRAEMEGLFTVESTNPCIIKVNELGIETEEGMLILRRDISANGKSICRVNGKLVTLAILREIGQALVDIHGQHEHQSIMQPERHLSMLDSFAKDSLMPTLTEYHHLYKKYQQLDKQVKQMTDNEQALAHRLDLIQYQLKEIENADLIPNEDELLSEEKYKLANSEKLYKTLHDSYYSLYGDGKGLDWLSLAMNHMEEAASIDKELSEMQETISNCFYLLEEASFSMRDRFEQLEFDPNRLNFIETRLNEINQLKRKYGENVAEIMEYAAKIEEEIDSLLNKDDRIQKLEAELEATILDMLVEAKALTKIRVREAQELSDQIHKQLRALYMEKTQFQIEFKEKKHSSKARTIDGAPITFYDNGIDSVEFLLSTNPGEPLKPLSKVASGGEISRIMLAMKTIFSNHQGVTSLIFDEVDTGVSGRVAQAIAEKIHHISVGSQVLCITHLPQVAAMADTHLYISKQELGDRVLTSVVPLTKEKCIDEVARMISGVEVTQLTKQHAQELLDLADKIKNNS